MTTYGSYKHDPIEIAGYLARRTIMLAVVAVVGPTLAILAAAAIALFSDDPLNPPLGLTNLAGILAIIGLLWFVSFLVMSLNSLRHHFWYHNRIDP